MLHNEYENFEVFCVAAVSNKSMKDLFLDAHKVRLEKSDREFDMCDVFSLESSGWLVFRSYLAFTKAEFQAELKVSPESLGLKVRMLTNDWGARFRGILMIGPANPHLRYQHNYENSCVQNTFKMLAASTLTVKQGDTAFKAIVDNTRKAGSMSQQMKCTTLTRDSVLALAREFRSIGDADRCDANSIAGKSEDEGEGEGEDSEDERPEDASDDGHGLPAPEGVGAATRAGKGKVGLAASQTTPVKEPPSELATRRIMQLLGSRPHRRRRLAANMVQSVPQRSPRFP